MSFLTWWDGFGSKLVPTPSEDNEEHARRVAAESWGAAVERCTAENERLRGVIAAILSCTEKDGWKDDIIEQCHMLALDAHNKQC